MRDERTGRACALGAALACGACLAGCASSFPAQHVNLSLKADTAEAGIYYALPKTVFDFRLDLERSEVSGGELYRVRECAEGDGPGGPPSGEEPCQAVSRTDQSGWTLLSAKIQPRSEPDLSHVYRVNPDTWWWITQSHTFSNGALGYLQSASSNGTNEALPILATVAKAAIGYAALGPAGAVAALASTAAGSADSAQELAVRGQGSRVLEWKALSKVTPQVAPKPEQVTRPVVFNGACTVGQAIDFAKLKREVAKLFGNGVPLPKLEIEQAQCIVAALDYQQVALAAAVKAQRQPLSLDEVKGAPAAYVATILKQRADFVEAIKQELADLRAALHVDVVADKARLSLVSRTSVEPKREALPWSKPVADWQAEAPGLADLQRADDLRASFFADQSVCFSVKAADDLSAIDLSRFAAQNDDVATDGKAPARTGTSKLGYRYRLPAKGQVALRLAKTGSNACHTGDGPWLAADSVGIAQFGPVLALPAYFSGKDVKVALELTEFGTMKSISLGQTARDASALTGTVDALADAKSKRAAAAKSAPVDAVNSQADLLVAQIKARLAQRCLDQLASLAPGADLPAECGK